MAYAMVQRDMSIIDSPTAPSDDVSIVEKADETTELRGLFPSRVELKSLLAIKLRNLDIFARKGAKMHGIEDN